MKAAMNSPIDDDKIYQVLNFSRNGPEGLQTVIVFQESFEGLVMGLMNPKRIFRGRGEVIAKIPAFNGQPPRDMPQMVDFKIEALDLHEAFQGFPVGLAVAQRELQEDVNRQIEAMKIQQGMNGRGLLKPS
jgi:hypothetical protein